MVNIAKQHLANGTYRVFGWTLAGTLVVAALLLCPALSWAQQPRPKPQSPATRAGTEDPQAERISSVMLLDRVAQLEASNRGISQRVDDSRNLTLTLFGGLVALLAAIGVPVIFRERRQLREVRELGRLEREKITSQLKEALTEIESQIATVRRQLDSETETLRKGLVDSLRAQMLVMLQQFEVVVSAQKTELLESVSPEVAKQAVEIQLQKYSEALQGLNAPPVPLDYVLRANFYLSQGGEPNATAALREIHRALELDSDNVDALVALSQALLQLGQEEEAWSHLIRANELAPNKPNVLTELVTTGLRLKRFDDVLRWSTVLGRDAESGTRAWVVRAQATALSRLGQRREAIRVLSDLLADEPQLSQIRAQLAETLLDAELFNDAERIATEGLTLNPADYQLLVLRARARSGTGRHQEALQDLAVAERENPRDVKIFITKARVLSALQDYDGAVAACQSGLGLRAPEALRALLNVNCAEALMRLDRVAEAVQAAEESVRLGHAYVANHLVLVQCLFCAERLPEALLAADEAAKFSKTPGAKAMLLFFAALSAYGVHGISERAERVDEEFRSAAANVTLSWDFVFIRHFIEARTDPEDVHERMLGLAEWAAGHRSS